MRPRRSPLTARSVLLSVLLGSRPPRLPVALLVRTTELFGISEGTARTALSRMTTAGEVAATDGAYELVGAELLARQRRQDESRTAATRQWDGTWLQVVVGAAGRRTAEERAAARTRLVDLRLAELREGVWMRPDNLAPAEVEDPVDWFTTTPRASAVELAGRLWDLPGWAARADELHAAMAALVERLEDGDRTALAEGFVVSADVLRHFQADPLLPDELRPDDWPGASLRADYDRYDAAYRAVLRDWFAESRSLR